ncbi:hypothetical protein [Methylobacterium planeticum]|uniref:Uncharacterized protein n=1 Tax=Methylobacterium planeticum TaxID=2615211 RepID=A0A6N6MHC4_9HYPH|nr:hypothetical protein [Methylobacterium planeticum]KAB1068143.1 hypothetical protein F6X51_27215 [Methylobacterium planeticum]
MVEVTDDSRARLTTIRRQIRRRTDILEEKAANKPVHTSEVRSLVEDMLRGTDERAIERARQEHRGL